MDQVQPLADPHDPGQRADDADRSEYSSQQPEWTVELHVRPFSIVTESDIAFVT
jgi:hypothetical protein